MGDRDKQNLRDAASDVRNNVEDITGDLRERANKLAGDFSERATQYYGEATDWLGQNYGRALMAVGLIAAVGIAGYMVARSSRGTSFDEERVA